jgi:hypothetical protein
MVRAEDLSGYPAHEVPPVVARAMSDADLAQYLVGVAAQSRERTDAVLAGLQTRAGSYLTLVIGLLPLSIAAVAVAIPGRDSTLIVWIGFSLLLAATVALIGSAVVAALASGMGLTATVNLEYTESQENPKTLAELKADEADIWNFAAILNMETSRRRAADLFRARQLTVIALALTLMGLTVVLFANGGLPATLNNQQQDAGM